MAQQMVEPPQGTEMTQLLPGLCPFYRHGQGHGLDTKV
jgi:hypothetical protein